MISVIWIWNDYIGYGYGWDRNVGMLMNEI